MEIRETIPQSNKETISHIDIRAILLCTTVGLLNSFFYSNLGIMAGLCVIEVFVLLWCLFRRNYIGYIAYFMVFLCFSMESESFVGISTFYGFKNFRFAGLNLAVWALLPMILISLLKYKYIFANIGRTHRSIIRKIILFTFVGTIMSLFTFLADDNGFASHSGSVNALVNSLYTYLIPCLEIIAVSFCIAAQRDRIVTLKKYLYSIIIGTAVVFLACLILGNYGNRGGLRSLQVSDVYFLLVCTIILLVYDEFDFWSKILLGISGGIILVLALAYNASGKIVIISVLIPIIMVIILRKRGSAFKTILMILIGVVALIFLSSYLMPLLMRNSFLLTTKYEQAMKLFSFGSGNWFDNIPSSPKMRITEFMNVAEEYIRKPWFAPLGKGFCGTVKDHLGLFTDLTEFSFSKWELDLGAYYSLHESINCFFLVGGLFGLYTIFSLITKTFKFIHVSPWLVFGFLWILLFYNYHLTIGIYGIVALIVGLEDIYESDIQYHRVKNGRGI